jgi:hypothetical protein
MTTSKKPGAALLALTASALSLPVYAPPAQAGLDTSNVQTGYRYSRYREDDIPADKLAGTKGERYRVDSHQFELVWPVTQPLGFSADAVYETMSGASPWYSTQGANGKAVQVMSGATIEDRRVALDVHTHLYQTDAKETLTLGISHERDYQSLSAGVDGAWSFDEQRGTLSGGIGYSHDKLTPTDAGNKRVDPVRRPDEANKNSLNIVLGFSQVLSAQTVAQVAFNYSLSNGYLSDPYKLAFVANTLVQDTRPDRRMTYAVTAKLRQYFPAVSAALHLDYRHFSDDWGVVSNSLDVSWQQKLPGDWKLVPGVRYYDQGMADFYAPYFNSTRADGNYSSDYRLSPYGALSYRLGLDKSWNNWQFSLGGEIYRSKASYALKQVSPSVESPGLVSFSVISVSAGYRF